MVRSNKQVIDTTLAKIEGSQCGGTLNNTVEEDLSQVTF